MVISPGGRLFHKSNSVNTQVKETFSQSQPAFTKGFGDRLAQERREKSVRERRDIGQKDVAAAIGSSGPSVSRWEAGVGMPSVRMMERLAAYFGVTLAWLHYGQGPREAPADPFGDGSDMGIPPHPNRREFTDDDEEEGRERGTGTTGRPPKPPHKKRR